MEGFEIFRVFVASIVACMAICTLINGILFYKRISYYLIKPIRTLNNETKNLVKNIESDEYKLTKIETGDELEELSDSFNQMNQDIRHYIKENIEMTAEKQRVGADLELASKIQQHLLPDVTMEREEVNTGRQPEVDLARAIPVISLPFVHCVIECCTQQNINEPIPFLFNVIIGAPLGAPIFVFAMGLSIVYSKHRDPEFLMKR